MNLSEKDIQLLERSFNVIQYAFGSDEFERRLGPGSLSTLEGSVARIMTERKVAAAQAKEIAECFSVAREIIDPIEFSTVTGFTWEEGSGGKWCQPPFTVGVRSRLRYFNEAGT